MACAGVGAGCRSLTVCTFVPPRPRHRRARAGGRDGGREVFTIATAFIFRPIDSCFRFARDCFPSLAALFRRPAPSYAYSACWNWRGDLHWACRFRGIAATRAEAKVEGGTWLGVDDAFRHPARTLTPRTPSLAHTQAHPTTTPHVPDRESFRMSWQGECEAMGTCRWF